VGGPSFPRSGFHLPGTDSDPVRTPGREERLPQLAIPAGRADRRAVSVMAMSWFPDMAGAGDRRVDSFWTMERSASFPLQ
jgi:hypothetical protein